MYTKHKWENDVYYHFNYVTYLPKEYDASKTYPLVLFLHGVGHGMERGVRGRQAVHVTACT